MAGLAEAPRAAAPAPRGRPLATVLCVEDDPLGRKVLAFTLAEAGYRVEAADQAAAALRVLQREEVHTIVLDVGLPQLDGLDFCRRLRAERIGTPVLLLTGRRGVEDTVAGFEAGADDYLAKPYEPRELVARVRALVGRQFWGTANVARDRLAAAGLELDLRELAVTLPSGRQVALTPTEMRVLQCLMTNAGRVVTRESLLAEAWGYDYETGSNPVEVYVRRVRRKIEAGPAPLIETVRGVGYRLLAPKAPQHPAPPA